MLAAVRGCQKKTRNEKIKKFAAIVNYLAANTIDFA